MSSDNDSCSERELIYRRARTHLIALAIVFAVYIALVGLIGAQVIHPGAGVHYTLRYLAVGALAISVLLLRAARTAATHRRRRLPPRRPAAQSARNGQGRNAL
ncbi:hypothetical protein [Nocardia tengchongensis]|uniref:hypothetical protein n=1 Tax=Nocardia tengchongensis TaxID=2055889 RepID=UPI0036582211